MKSARILFFLWMLASCVTPMSQSEIDEVTTCKDITIASVRKNLLLNGFVIDKETTTDLVTEFKQTDYWHSDRSFIRVSAIDLGDSRIKLKVRVKSIRIHRDEGIGLGVSSFERRSRQSNSVILDFSRPIEVEDEEDETYFDEHRGRYQLLKHQVCGQ